MARMKLEEKELLDSIKANKVKIQQNQRTASLSEEQLEDVFIPEIFEEDNLLCKLIKEVLIENPINLRIYAHRFSSEQELSNMKRSLRNNHTMTWERFTKWCYVLGLDAEITLTSKDDNNY